MVTGDQKQMGERGGEGCEGEKEKEENIYLDYIWLLMYYIGLYTLLTFAILQQFIFSIIIIFLNYN